MAEWDSSTTVLDDLLRVSDGNGVSVLREIYSGDPALFNQSTILELIKLSFLNEYRIDTFLSLAKIADYCNLIKNFIQSTDEEAKKIYPILDIYFKAIFKLHNKLEYVRPMNRLLQLFKINITIPTIANVRLNSGKVMLKTTWTMPTIEPNNCQSDIINLGRDQLYDAISELPTETYYFNETAENISCSSLYAKDIVNAMIALQNTINDIRLNHGVGAFNYLPKSSLKVYSKAILTE